MASASTSSSGTGNAATSNPRDPSGYLTSPTNPSTVVKVVGTGRDDINGLLGIAVSYNLERERYLVHIPVSQSTMALKKENLQTAGFLESYQAQWQQLRNDPRVKEKMNHYMTWCQQHVQPFQLTHVVGAVVALWIGLWLCFGFTKTVMVTSLLLLLVVVVGQDLIVARVPPREVLRRFPMRARETLEQQMPALKGRLTDRVAAFVILLLVTFCAHSLFLTSGGKANASPNGSSSKATSNGIWATLMGSDSTGGLPAATSSSSSSITKKGLMDNRDFLRAVYNAGFQDATDQRENGHSFQVELDRWEEQHGEKHRQRMQPSRDDGSEADRHLYSDEDDPLFPHPSSQPPAKSIWSKLMSFSTMGSAFFVYRLVKDKGTDHTTGLFSMGQLAANLQHHTEVWQQGMLLYSIYNIVRTVLF
jgi:hypothetical protein